MRLIRGDLDSLPRLNGSVISIGNYDGVHLGHQALIDELKRWAKTYSLPATIITFEPYPWEYFQSSKALPRLTAFPEKLQLFENADIDQVICLEFNQKVANTKPDDFIHNYLVDKFKVKCLVLGNDFRFGKDRAGSVELLDKLAVSCNFQIVPVNSVVFEGKRVSSSNIRSALEYKDLSLATKLLGRRYGIGGRVAYGDQRGREWGFPTANIHLNPNDTPLRGVFSVLVDGLSEEPKQGIANLGSRPTIAGKKFLLETHIFNFSANVYGESIRVQFCEWVRDELKFDGLLALKKQVEKDIKDVKNYFQLNSRDD